MGQEKPFVYAENVVERLKTAEQLVIFGAGNVAQLVANCLMGAPYHLKITYCMVSEGRGNPPHLEGIPVVDYEAAEKVVRRDALVLIAVMERYLESVQTGLCQHGYTNLLPLTYEDDLWSLLRGNSYRNNRLSAGKSYLMAEEELQKIKTPAGAEKKKIRVYRACSHRDKPLKEELSHYCWETPIQVGSALTGEGNCGIRDDKGENISDKNRQYCELTALYWIWKNDRSDYVGLCHYRRHFELDWEQINKLADSGADVLLTIPIMDYPDVGTVYRRDHVGADWDVMFDAVSKLCPGYTGAVREMESGQFYYAYNMFIMRREILEHYCRWLFPILSYCEEHCSEKGDVYQNRYIGFLAEHLMSAYFLHHEKQYTIVHVRKHFVW